MINNYPFFFDYNISIFLLINNNSSREELERALPPCQARWTFITINDRQPVAY